MTCLFIDPPSAPAILIYALEAATLTYSTSLELFVWPLLVHCSKNDLKGYIHVISFGETWTASKPVLEVILFFLTGIPSLLEISFYLPNSSLCLSKLGRKEHVTFMLHIPGPSSAWNSAWNHHLQAPLTKTDVGLMLWYGLWVLVICILPLTHALKI